MSRIKIALLGIVFSLLLSALPAQKLGFALSGGGARGLAHIGMLKVLEEYGVRPDYISGTSIGAFIGALYAMGYNSTQIESIVIDAKFDDLIDDSYKRKDIYIGQKRWAPYGNISFELSENWNPEIRTGLFNANRLNLKLASIYANASAIRDFDDLPIPFCAVATDLLSGEQKVFHDGSLMQAVRASLTVPSVIRAFEIDKKLYIDGGVSNNFPVDQCKEMGADIVIGLKTNSPLRDRNELTNLIEVLDQTINIGMTRTIDIDADSLSLFLSPDLDQFRASSFDDAAEIIAAGEAHAREHIVSILLLLNRYGYKPKEKPAPLPNVHTFPISRIEVEGNTFISKTKILEYLKLKSGSSYSIEEIVRSCFFVWNSQYFRNTYPVLIPDGHAFILNIVVEEKARNELSLNISYNNEEQLHASGILSMSNYILKNSRLLAELKLGTNSEVNLDYVKNFGEFWGAYYRIFSYITEQTSYLYDNDHHKTDSVKRLEYGISSGIGVFGNELLNLEGFLYTYKAHLYRDISQFMIPRQFTISGFGIKAYHESLDDYVFPRSGTRWLSKFNFARDEEISDYIYNKFYTNLEIYRPYNHNLSFVLGLQYGSYFDKSSQLPQVDPYYLGGSDGYMGVDKYELSSPFYKIYQLGFRYNPARRLFLDIGLQSLNHGDHDDWSLRQDLQHSIYLGVGYRSMLGPINAAVAFPLDSRPRFYINFGYSADIFEYSRR